MAPLPDLTRKEAMARLASLMNSTGPVGLTKPEIKAAVDAMDDWIEANAVAINTAIPQPARGVLTTPQKAALLSYVALARFGG